jgi:hypothetical protein
LKKLSNQLQPYFDVVQVIAEMFGAFGMNVRVLHHILSYAEFQFGDGVRGKSYRERRNGDRISNWTVEITFLELLYSVLIGNCNIDESLGTIIQDDMKLPYLEKMRQLLMPWSILIDSDDTNLKDVLNKDDTNFILHLLANNECDIACVYMHRYEFGLAELHCQRALHYAKRYDGEEELKTSLLCKTFTAYGSLRSSQGNYGDAVTFFEEAYNCVAMAYNPVHPEVQRTGCNLIECLILKGDLYDAERFSQMTVDSLKDPANGVDQDSDEVAEGCLKLGRVIVMQDGDLVKAERLAREAHRIRIHLYGNNSVRIGPSAGLIADILKSQNKLGDETRELYDCFLAGAIMNEGPDGINTAIGNFNLGLLHLNLADTQTADDKRKEYLCLAKSYLNEAIRISTKIYGPIHQHTIQNTSILSAIESKLLET